MWSRRRRPSFARRRFRESLRAFLLRNWLRLSGVTAFFVAIGVVESVLLDGYALGLVHGVLLVAGPAMVLVLFMAHTGAIWQFAGFVGEDNTRDELKKALARRYIWGWVDNIEVSDGDIDHLIIAPAGGLRGGLEVACTEAQLVAARQRRPKRDHRRRKGALSPEITQATIGRTSSRGRLGRWREGRAGRRRPDRGCRRRRRSRDRGMAAAP